MNQRFLALLLVIFSCLTLALMAAALTLDSERCLTHGFGFWLWIVAAVGALGFAAGTGLKNFTTLSRTDDNV